MNWLSHVIVIPTNVPIVCLFVYTECQMKLQTFVFSISSVNINVFWYFFLHFEYISTGVYPYTHVKSIWPNECRIFRSDVDMQFFCTSISCIGILKTGLSHCWCKTTHYFLSKTAFNTPMMSENQRNKSLRMLTTGVSATGVTSHMDYNRRSNINLQQCYHVTGTILDRPKSWRWTRCTNNVNTQTSALQDFKKYSDWIRHIIVSCIKTLTYRSGTNQTWNATIRWTRSK